MVCKEVGEDDMNWMHLVQQQYKLQTYGNTVMDLWVP